MKSSNDVPRMDLRWVARRSLALAAGICAFIAGG
ncbi:MAG: hypothetical protein QOF48_45, partial [Verrucomicrobiota bacterium]